MSHRLPVRYYMCPCCGATTFGRYSATPTCTCGQTVDDNGRRKPRHRAHTMREVGLIHLAHKETP